MMTGLQVGVCSTCQYHFVDGFTGLSKALQKALFKKTCWPLVKPPLNYSPNECFSRNSLSKFIYFNAWVLLEFWFRYFCLS